MRKTQITLVTTTLVIFLFAVGVLLSSFVLQGSSGKQTKPNSVDEIIKLNSLSLYSFGYYDTQGTHIPITEQGIADMWKQDFGLPQSVFVVNLSVNSEIDNGVIYFTLTAKSSDG